jgi:hypothetical protein
MTLIETKCRNGRDKMSAARRLGYPGLDPGVTQQFCAVFVGLRCANPTYMNVLCSFSVSSSAGNIDSKRNSCAAMLCGAPTVVTIEK